MQNSALLLWGSEVTDDPSHCPAGSTAVAVSKPKPCCQQFLPINPEHSRERVQAHSCDNLGSSNRCLGSRTSQRPGQGFLETALESGTLPVQSSFVPVSSTGVRLHLGLATLTVPSPLSFTGVSCAHRCTSWHLLLGGPECTLYLIKLDLNCDNDTLYITLS